MYAVKRQFQYGRPIKLRIRIRVFRPGVYFVILFYDFWV